MIRNDHALAFTYTRVIARFIRTADAFVASDRWVGTNGPGGGDTFLLRSSRLVLRGNDLSGCTAVSLPSVLATAWMPLGGIGARIWNRAQHRSPRTASAMLHSRYHVHPHELTSDSFAHFCRDVLVVIDSAERCDIGIAPAVIEDQLAARMSEGLEICIRGIAYWPELIVQKRDIAVEVETPESHQGF